MHKATKVCRPRCFQYFLTISKVTALEQSQREKSVMFWYNQTKWDLPKSCWLSFVQEFAREEGNNIYGKTQRSPCRNPNRLKWNLAGAWALCQLIKGECVLSLDVKIVEWLNLGIGFCSLHWSSWELLQKAGADVSIASLQLALPRRVWSAKPNDESQGKTWCLLNGLDFDGFIFVLFCVCFFGSCCFLLFLYFVLFVVGFFVVVCLFGVFLG